MTKTVRSMAAKFKQKTTALKIYFWRSEKKENSLIINLLKHWEGKNGQTYNSEVQNKMTALNIYLWCSEKKKIFLSLISRMIKMTKMVKPEDQKKTMALNIYIWCGEIKKIVWSLIYWSTARRNIVKLGTAKLIYVYTWQH